MLLDPHIERIAQDVAGVLVIVGSVMQIAVAQHDPPNMTPKERHQRTVRVFWFITVRMVHAMRGRPPRRRILKTAERAEYECVLKPTRRIETAVREQAVVAHGDGLPKHVNASNTQDHRGP
jgi:hypothetical protein